LLLLLSIFAAVIVFAIAMFQAWMIAKIDPFGGKHVVVYDSDGKFITRTDSFVGNEGPVRVYRIHHGDTHAAAILGTRGEAGGGFTTRQRLYYSDSTTCNGALLWILDPTTAAAAATQFLRWSDTTSIPPVVSPLLPDGVGYGHPISDYYTLQTIAFAIGPMADGLIRLHRAHGSLSTPQPDPPPVPPDPPLPPGYDPEVFGYPASEWASERYGAARCRQIGNLTDDPLQANAEQQALVPYLMQVDESYDIVDKGGVEFVPNFWTPTKVYPDPPVPVIGTNQVQFTDGLPEGAPLPSGVTTTGADGLIHTPPSGGEDSSPP
jgi:hypothetical protein